MDNKKKKNDCLYEFSMDHFRRPLQTKDNIDKEKIYKAYEYGEDYFLKTKEKEIEEKKLDQNNN